MKTPDVKFMIPLEVQSLNKVMRMFWAARIRAKRIWHQALMVHKRKVGERVFKTLKITAFRARLLDKDNLYGGAKMVVDVIKDFGWIEDDSPDKLELTVEQKKSKDRMTLIELGGI